MPSQSLLNRIDPTGDLPRDQFLRLMMAERDMFMKLVPHPNDEARSWDLRTILDVSESFRVLVPFRGGEEWSPFVLAKCSCPGMHKDAACHHSLLMSMLANPDSTIPQQYIAARMEDRKKRGRRSFTREDDDEEDVLDEVSGAKAWTAQIIIDSEQEDDEPAEEMSREEACDVST